jgi:2-succinyl-6-hydroxy-2,4-cyclohexadiene-1-carboxylate synthase
VSRARRLVLLHGFTGSARSWGPPALAGLEHAGLAPRPLDLPGHGARAGEVGPARFTRDSVVHEVARALESRAASEPEPEGRGVPPALLGYSMGGRLALHCAAALGHRIGALVLESASPGLRTESERTARRVADEALAARIEAQGVEAFVAEWEALPLFASQAGLTRERREALRQGRLANDAASLAAALRGLGTGVLPSLWDRLGEIRVPTLVLAGGLDRKFVGLGERMAAALPNATLRVVPDAGHTVHLERPDTWVRAVHDFLSVAAGG